MPNRTPESQWGALFNFAGAGIVHQEIFALIIMTAENPTLFEAISRYLLLFGTAALKPSASDVPLNAIYFETDTGDGFQNQAGSWEQISTATGGGGGATLAQGTLAGRGSASGSGVYEQITLGSNISLSGTTLNVSPGGTGGGLILIQKQLLTSPATTITFSGLDGNTDVHYLITGKWRNDTGSTSVYTLRPNGQTTNLSSSQVVNNNTTLSGVTDSDLRFGNFLTGSFGGTVINLWPQKNPDAQSYPLIWTFHTGHYDGTRGRTASGGGIWNETSTNVTSIDLVSSISNGFPDGTYFALYKLAQA